MKLSLIIRKSMGLVAFAIGLPCCASFNNLHTPDTLPSGKTSITIGQTPFAVKTYSAKHRHLGTNLNSVVRQEYQLIPTTMQFRIGAAEGVDMGIAVNGPDFGSMDIKFRVLSGKVPIALMPTMHMGRKIWTGGTVLLGARTSETTMFILSPGASYLSEGLSDFKEPDWKSNFAPGGPEVHGGLAFRIKAGKDVAFQGDFSVMKFLGDLDVTWYNFGFGFIVNPLFYLQ
jgi:hypothetical protein